MPATESFLEELVRARLRRRIDDWQARGIIAPRTAATMSASLEAPPGASPPRPSAASATALEQWADEVAGSFQRLASWRPGWGDAFFHSLEEAAKAEREAARHGPRGRSGDSGEDDLGLALGSGGALLSQGGAGALGGGLDALVALDAPGGVSGREGSLKLHEYVWWFLGALLVLGGSIMGVREAWRTLGGVERQLIVTGALFVYHAGFIGLGVFLGRRALSAGRVLAGIGLALLPVVFVALSALTAMAPGLGVGGALLVTGLGFVTLRVAGRLLHGTQVSALAVALFPSLLAGLPLMWLEDAPWPRVLCAFVGVGAVAASLWRSNRAGAGLAPLVSAGVALYGALALALFSMASAPEGFDALEPGSPTFAGMVLWAIALAAVVAGVATRGTVREAFPRAAPVVEILAHAVGAGGALAGGVAAFALVPGSDAWVDLASALTPATAALAFFLLESRRPTLVHLAVAATVGASFLLGRVQVPGDVGWWCVGPAVVAAVLILVARQSKPGALRIRLLAWGVVLSLSSMLLVSVATLAWGQGSAWPKVATGMLVAAAAHLAAGHRWRGLHYLGGIAAPFAALAARDTSPWLPGDGSAVAILVLLAAAYGIAALVHRAWARGPGHSMELSPLDDLSLAGASLVVLLSFGSAPVMPEAFGVSRGLWGGLISSAPLAVAAVLLLLRVRRDQSRLVSFLAASGVALATVLYWEVALSGTDSPLPRVLPAALTLGLAAIAALRGQGGAEAGARIPRGRRLLGAIRLPWAESGRPLFTDGFAGAALLAGLVATLPLIGWIPNPLDVERPLVLLASGLLVGTALLAFFTRGFVALRLRGSVVTLVAAGGLIALTAILNRAGRPLPPDVTAWRLPLIGVALWGFALVTRRYGPWLAGKLENESQGRLYHLVPHAGVAVLGLVLVKGALSIGAPAASQALGLVPPLMPLGAALLALLLASSFRSARLAHLGLLLGLPGAALWAAQQALTGPSLALLVQPDGPWVRAAALAALPGLRESQLEAWVPPGATLFLVWQRAFTGIAAMGLAYAAAALILAWVGAHLAFVRRLLSLVPEDAQEAHALSLTSFREELLQALRGWAVTAAGLVFAAAFFQPGLSSAVLTGALGVMLFLGGMRSQGRGVVAAGVLLLVHAVAHREPVVAAWPGPLLTLVGLAIVILGPWVAQRRGLTTGSARVRIHLAGTVYALAGTVYALAAGGATEPAGAVPRLLWEALTRLDGRWLLSPALPVTVGLVATILLVGAFQWRGALAALDALGGSFLAGVAAVCGLSVLLVARAGEGWEAPTYGRLLATHGAALALTAAGSAALVHAAGQWLRARRRDVGDGLRLGRDAWLLGCGGLLVAVAVLLRGPDGDALPRAIAALGLAVLVALHCAWSEHTGRHVYFVQVAVVGVYALVRSLYATGLRPEHDALFALGLGFVLVGVTVMAHRAGIPPVADATRRFAALLPLLVWWVLPSESSGEAALLAGGSGLLYAAIGAVEHSRLFGSLAAAACNLALLVAALAFGLEGLEVYLAPLGLLLLMLGQLFSGSLPRAARNGVRILGGMLLYVPAAAKLSLQAGLAADGTYALIFGGACLLGVMVGMALQIRAYLALGTLFLTLNVVANLVHAGLRDHRVGFVVMTLTGLAIVGGRVMATLRRQQLELLMSRVRVTLRGWD